MENKLEYLEIISSIEDSLSGLCEKHEMNPIEISYLISVCMSSQYIKNKDGLRHDPRVAYMNMSLSAFESAEEFIKGVESMEGV